MEQKSILKSDHLDAILWHTLWSPDGMFLEYIDDSHIFYRVLVQWNLEPTKANVCVTPLPGAASQARNTADKSSKPMTQPINLVPVAVTGGLAMMLGDVRSQQIYEQWKLRVDSYPDYMATMKRRGRYIGRLQQGQGV